MAVSWILVVMAAAVFVSMVLLAVVCLNCGNKGPQVSISQVNTSEESSDFRVIHSAQPTIDRSSIHPSSNRLSPFSPSTDPRHRSFTQTETGSVPSYENPADGPDYINTESDAEDTGYIIVLPEGAAPQPSRASTPSSDILHDYENVPQKEEAAPVNKPSDRLTSNKPSVEEDEDDEDEDEEEDREYLNVEPLHFQRPTSELTAESSSDDDDDDDDDDEGNYVNVSNGTV